MDDSLRNSIEQARARGPMTREEIDAQRRSFVLAEAGFGSDADEAEYAAALVSGDEGAIAECKRKEGERIAAASRILDGHE